MAKHLLLIGIGCVVATLLVVLKRAERSSKLSFSLHAAQSRVSYYIFASGLTAAVVCWVLWMAKWFAPRFHLGWLFTSVFFTALVLLLVAAWVRWEKGVKGKIHDFAAYRMAYLMPVLPAIMTMNTHISLFVRWLSVAVLLCQVFLLSLLFFVSAMRRRYLHYQLTYIGLTFLVLLIATYA